MYFENNSFCIITDAYTRIHIMNNNCSYFQNEVLVHYSAIRFLQELLLSPLISSLILFRALVCSTVVCNRSTFPITSNAINVRNRKCD